MLTTFTTLDDLRAAAGTHLGHTGWLAVDQARVDLFAEATDDRQWIHVDVERAAGDSPFGGTTAHGYLTLALTNLFLPQLIAVPAASSGVNYGTGRVRFPAPLLVGDRIRASAEITAVDDVPGGVQTTIAITVEREGGGEPTCVVESLSRWLV